MPRFSLVRAALLCAFAATGVFARSAAVAQTPPNAPASAPLKAKPSGLPPLGLPQDAGPHDGSAAIEWWYFNSFLTGESGRKWAVVGSFFRTGLPGGKKGHYLIYSLADLDANKTKSYSIVDQDDAALLKTFMSAQALQNPSDPRPLQFLARLKNNKLPAPHQLAKSAIVKTAPLFSIALQNSSFSQTTPDARNWAAKLAGENWALNLDFKQETRPPMLVGGKGRTGLRTPGDMAYVSLTRAETLGTLTVDGKSEKVTGLGWIDRQWGTSWIAQNNGWDWWGVQLSDGSDLIVYRVKDNVTGKILRAEATLLRANGTQSVEKSPVFTAFARWKDSQTGIAFPIQWKISLPTLGVSLDVAPNYPAQTIPVLGIGDAIWEGVIRVSGTSAFGKTPITGQGYMELVGYKASAATSGAKTANAAVKGAK